MAYARVWTKANPPGGQAANTADDEIRNLREDIEQRMATLVGGWTTGFTSDPITVNPEILGNVAGKSQTIHHGAFRPGNTCFAVNITDLYLESNDGVSMDVHAPLLVPAGCTLVTVSFLVNRNGGGNITGSLRYNDFTAAPATTTVGTVTTVVVAGAAVKSLYRRLPVILPPPFLFTRNDTVTNVHPAGTNRGACTSIDTPSFDPR